jgi:hypothetical protein
MNQLDADLIAALRRLGIYKKPVLRLGLNTQLLRDLHVYGDIAESIFEQLRDEFYVDISNFKFHEYFPDEFPNHSGFEKLWYWFNPFRPRPSVKHAEYKPVTVGMIRNSISDRFWHD